MEIEFKTEQTFKKPISRGKFNSDRLKNISHKLMLTLLNTAAAAAESLQSCSTLCDPIDGSPPGSPVPGILQARTLEWLAISFSNAWKWKVKVKSLSRVRLLATPWTAAYQAPPPMGFSRQEYWSGVPLPSLAKRTQTQTNKLEKGTRCFILNVWACFSFSQRNMLSRLTENSPQNPFLIYNFWWWHGIRDNRINMIFQRQPTTSGWQWYQEALQAMAKRKQAI